MRFTPQTKEELDSMNLMKAGVYSFRVANAQEQTSKSGNDMLKLTLEVFNDLGGTHSVFDYLLQAMPQKLYAFCYAVNLTAQYGAGMLTAQDCIGKCAYVDIVVKKGNDNPQGGTYPDRNEVKTYMSMAPATKAKPNVATPGYDPNKPFDDDLPF